MPSARALRYLVFSTILILVLLQIANTYHVQHISHISKSIGIDLTAVDIGPAINSMSKPSGFQRENATFVTLVKNEELWGLVSSIKDMEYRFNHKYHYDWVFLNDGDFSEEFKNITSSFVSGNSYYGKIPKEHWSYPPHIDQEKAAKCRFSMSSSSIIYGSSESYRFMCWFNSGYFFRHPLMNNYRYYWRVEPHVKFTCDIPEDPFKFMRENNKKYGFTISLTEYKNTIETLWDTVRDFMKTHPKLIAKDNNLDFVSDDDGDTYNLCHFWSNFEIADLEFWRSEAYMQYFDFLDKAGGFFYERWGDAPVHSIAASILLPKNQTHYFEDIGYYHDPHQNCPLSESKRMDLRCTCPGDNDIKFGNRNFFFYNKGRSCTAKFLKVAGKSLPEGWDKDQEK